MQNSRQFPSPVLRRMLAHMHYVYRGHYNLGQLTPGMREDIWIDIGVPTKQGSRENNTSTLRDKVVGALVGAKGSHPSDVEATQAHIQVTTHKLNTWQVHASPDSQGWRLDCRLFGAMTALQMFLGVGSGLRLRIAYFIA